MFDDPSGVLEAKDPTAALALVGAFVGPFVDAIHNQALLSSLVWMVKTYEDVPLMTGGIKIQPAMT